MTKTELDMAGKLIRSIFDSLDGLIDIIDGDDGIIKGLIDVSVLVEEAVDPIIIQIDPDLYVFKEP